MDNRPIGIFDSGVGGLTVVSEVIKQLPNEEVIYFGDTARVPYGTKSKDVITKFSIQLVNFMLERNVKAVVIACGTISTNSYETLKSMFQIPMIEVVTPGVEACLAVTKNNVVGVIGTEASIKSGVHERYFKERNANIKVYTKACPLFVPLAEEGWTRNSVASTTAEIYLQELIDTEIDSLLLGCTHYPMLYECISKVVGNINIVNPAIATAQKLKDFLTTNDMLNDNKTIPKHSFFVSDNTTKFNRTSRIVLNKTLVAHIVDIAKY